MEWEFHVVGYRNGKYCCGCNDAGEEYEFEEGDLKKCKSGFCESVFCKDCRTSKYRGMLEAWAEYVEEHAVGVKGVEPQKEEEGSEEYNPEYLEEFIVEGINRQDELRPKKWCVECTLFCKACPNEECGLRAFLDGECKVCGYTKEGGPVKSAGVKRKVEAIYAVDKCTVTQTGAKKLRIEIDLTIE